MSRTLPRPRLDPADLPPLRWLLGGVLSLLGISTVLYTDVDAGLLMPLAAVAVSSTHLTPPTNLPLEASVGPVVSTYNTRATTDDTYPL